MSDALTPDQITVQPAEVDLFARRPLRCIVPGCPGSPFAAHGYHLVQLIDPEATEVHAPRPAWMSSASAFVCSTHLPVIETALADHARGHAESAWEVETYRMYGWEDDGRGSIYSSASGTPGMLF